MPPDSPSVPTTADADFRSAVEASPFWPLLIALAEIAVRIEQLEVEKLTNESDDEAA